MFKHVANYAAGIAWHNSMHDHKVKADFSASPHAIFTHPQVASVGLKEEQSKQQNYNILVGRAYYRDTAMGAAMGFPEGFVKVVVEKETGKILGAHIIGPEASILIQEIINAMVVGKGRFFAYSQGNAYSSCIKRSCSKCLWQPRTSLTIFGQSKQLY